MSTLDEVRALVLDGRIAAARALLGRVWRDRASGAASTAVTPALLDEARATVNLTLAYDWRDVQDAVHTTLRALRARSAALEAERRAVLALHDPQPSGAAGRFFRWFLPRADRDATLWKPWIATYHIACLVRDNRLAEARRRLTGGPGTARPRSPLDVGRRLLHIGMLHMAWMRYDRAFRLFDSAERQLGAPGTHVETELLRSQCMGMRARCLGRAGRREEGLALAATAERIAARLRSGVALAFARLSRAHVLRMCGDSKEALEAYGGAGPTGGAGDERPYSWLQSRFVTLVHSAKAAMLEQRLGFAQGQLDEAAELLRGRDEPKFATFLRLTRAELELARGTEEGLQVAERLVDKAARRVEEDDWFNTPMHVILLLQRGWIALRRNDVDGALRCALTADELSSTHRQFEAQSLYLQSMLLLRRGAPRARLYDRTLARLGVIDDPTLLFRVLANLYLYTWDLGAESLELSDLHMKQILGMRSSLGDRRFRDLYEAHVARPVAARFRTGLLGR